MAKLELKAVQKELEQGVLWPLYWLYGTEKLKSRELLKRIRKAVLGEEIAESSIWSWSEEVFDGSETDASTVLDSVKSPTLGGGIKLVVIRDANALKNSEILAEICGPPQKKSEITSVCVCISKDLDARKKFSKILVEKAAVVPCEEVGEDQRHPWIQYLAKRRGIELTPSLVLQLGTLDPWSLDIIEQELEKLSITNLASDAVLEGPAVFGGAEGFLDSFFSRNLQSTLPQVSQFADRPDESLPLLGLLGWNVRQLALLIADRENGTKHAKVNPYLAEKFRKWISLWKLTEIVELQAELLRIDFSLKQTPLMPLGLWNDLVMRYCIHR